MIIERKGLVRGNTDVWEFRVVPNVEGTQIHIFLDQYYRCRPRHTILADSPRWARNDPRFSNLEAPPIPDDVIEEVLSTLRTNMVLHLPEKKDDGPNT